MSSLGRQETVLIVLLGVGIAKEAALRWAATRALVLSTLRIHLTTVVMFSAIVSDTNSSKGYMVLVPLAAAAFQSVGRKPWIGHWAAFDLLEPKRDSTRQMVQIGYSSFPQNGPFTTKLGRLANLFFLVFHHRIRCSSITLTSLRFARRV